MLRDAMNVHWICRDMHLAETQVHLPWLLDEHTIYLKRRLYKMKEDVTCGEEIEIPELE